jgi:phosphopantothenoylcysteine decarboxylase/phosphopantothenate--cysteine ligase
MGFALAGEARRRGAEVVLVVGPTALEPPEVDHLLRIRSAGEMHAAVMAESDGADAVIMAAAVADYTPAGGAAVRKLAKGGPMTIALERTADILADLGARRGDADRPVLVGFAAESGDPVASARRKLETKRVDLIVANDISATDAGFDAATNRVSLVSPEGTADLPLLPKTDVAAAVLDRVEQLLANRPAPATAR